MGQIGEKIREIKKILGKPGKLVKSEENGSSETELREHMKIGKNQEKLGKILQCEVNRAKIRQGKIRKVEMDRESQEKSSTMKRMKRIVLVREISYTIEKLGGIGVKKLGKSGEIRQYKENGVDRENWRKLSNFEKNR